MAREWQGDTFYGSYMTIRNPNTGKEVTEVQGPYQSMGAASSQLTRAKNDLERYKPTLVIVESGVRRGDVVWTKVDPAEEKRRLKAELAAEKKHIEEELTAAAQARFWEEMNG